jgi:hypothetical protein
MMPPSSDVEYVGVSAADEEEDVEDESAEGDDIEDAEEDSGNDEDEEEAVADEASTLDEPDDCSIGICC